MSSALTRFNTRIAQIAVGRHLSYRTVRVRLTLLYGGLFLLSGAALMVIAYLLLANAGFVFTLQSGSSGVSRGSAVTPAGSAQAPRLPNAGILTHPSSATIAYWRDVARCMRRRGVAGFPEPLSSVPRGRVSISEVSDRDGAILLFPASVDQQSPSFRRAASGCGFYEDSFRQLAQENSGRSRARQQLLLQSGIALAGMTLLSLGLGWLMAGRVLQPLEDSYEAQRQFVANASHELRAPLTRQRALIQVALADPNASMASLRAAHERVLAAEVHLEQMIGALLTLSRGQAGLERHEQVDLAALASAVTLAHEADARALGLSVSATLEHAPTQGDPRLIERLLANLIGNAIRHNAPGGQVEVVTGTRERAAFVSVTNTGPVVGPEHVERLLRPFERLGGARTAHDGGHGLGLSIVRAIADAHRAQLRVVPQPEGGLRVELVLPAARAGSPIRIARNWSRRAAPRTTLGD
jgi:signal transduction histidine kinase